MRYSLVAFALALVFVFSACGGDSAADSDDGGGGDDPTATAASGGGGNAATPTDSDSGDSDDDDNGSSSSSGSGEAGTATTTIGDQTWQFAMNGNPQERCELNFSGAGILTILMFGEDENGAEITLTISGPTSGGAGQVTAGDALLVNARWTADPEVYDRLANVEGMPEGVSATFQVNGNTVSGSGVFYDDTALTEARQVTGAPYEAGVLEGTFEATCAG